MKRLLKYFFNGLLIVIPFGITLYIIYFIVAKLDAIVPSLLGWDAAPGLGLLLFLIITMLLGYLGSSLIAKPALTMIENSLYKVPVISLIYSSSKDFINAFIGEKKRFNQPVLVEVNKELNIQRFGFITQNDLSALNIVDKVAVYFPHSYNISGNLLIVSTEHVMIVHAPSSEIMKFIVSGGVAGLNIIKKAEKAESSQG